MFKSTTETKAINIQIKSISRRGVAWQEDVQMCALNILTHLDAHNDITLVNRLVAAMPVGARVNSLQAWFEKHSGKLEYNEETKEFGYVRHAEASDMEAATAEKWYDTIKPPAFKPLDLNKMIAGLIRKADKALADESDLHVIDESTLTALRSLVEVE